MAGAIFVVAETGAGQQGPVAALLSTAGWATAAERVLGEAWIVGRGGILDPLAARQAGSHASLASPATSWGWRRRIPTPVKTLVKDVRHWQRSRTFEVDPAGPWGTSKIDFVWQRHDLFHLTGLRLATALRVPSVTFVPATIVWQAERWGVHRPGWGRWLERHAEAPPLRAADVVACGSEEVAEQALRLGVSEARVVVTSSGVDLELFTGEPARSVRPALRLGDGFVLGWVGSFRAFHALDQLVDAAARLGGISLLLVGDGPERPRVERLAADMGVPAVFTGTVPHVQMRDHLAAMDAAVVLAQDGAAFHYSPLKLAEYLAAGLPVIAPRVPQLARRLHDGVDSLLVDPGDTAALVGALRRLRDGPALRADLGRGARSAAERDWSWDHAVRLVVGALAGQTG